MMMVKMPATKEGKRMTASLKASSGLPRRNCQASRVRRARVDWRRWLLPLKLWNRVSSQVTLSKARELSG